MRLVFAEFAPYQYEQDGRPAGIGVKAVQRVLERDLGFSLELRMVPNYGRALAEVSSGGADGFFLASQNLERDKVAVFSEPLMVNRWSWFFNVDAFLEPNSAQFLATARVATLLHTNTHRWLNEQGYRHIMPVMKSSLLPRLLDQERIDAVFLAEVVFAQEAAATGFEVEDFTQVVAMAKPFGIYISNHYLEENKGFMTTLNEAIKRDKRLLSQ